MSTQLIGVILIGFCAFLSLLQGFICARKAMKQRSNAMTAFAAIFLGCGMILVLCLSSIRM